MLRRSRPRLHLQVEARDGRGARAGAHELHLADVLADDLEAVEDRRRGDDRRAVLVVVEHRNLHPLAQLLLDVEALGRLDVLEVDAAERRLQRRDHLDDLVRIRLADLDVEDVDAGELLEDAALALHHRLACQRADVAEAEHRGAVGDHGDQVRPRGVAGGQRRVLLDREAGVGHARRVGERKVALVGQRLGRRDGDLPGGRKLVILERVDAQLLFVHDALSSYFFLTGGRSVHTPSNTSAAMPMLSRQRRMRMDRLADVDRIAAHLDGEADFADQVARVRADDAAADAAVRRLVEQQLGEAFVAAVGDRAAGRRPGEHRLAVLDALRLALVLGEAGPRHFRIGVGDRRNLPARRRTTSAPRRLRPRRALRAPPCARASAGRRCRRSRRCARRWCASACRRR